MSLSHIESTQGRRLDLPSQRNKTVVIFYEARGHTEDNLELKESCGLMVGRGWLGNRFDVIGVADVEGLGGGLVTGIVRTAVRAVAARYGTELWMDFHGELKRAPYSLDGGRGSTVALLDPTGRVTYRGHGRLDANALEGFFDALSAATGQTADASAKKPRAWSEVMR